MSRHTVAICEHCCTLYIPGSPYESTYVKVESTGQLQIKRHAELCLDCANRLHSILVEFFNKREFTTTAQVSVTNEEYPGVYLVQATHVKKG